MQVDSLPSEPPGKPRVGENLTVLGVGLGGTRAVGMQGVYLSVPDVHTLVEGAAGQVLPVGAEGHAVHGFLVLGERVDAHAPLHVPKSDGRIERGAAKTQRRSPRTPVGSKKVTTLSAGSHRSPEDATLTVGVTFLTFQRP